MDNDIPTGAYVQAWVWVEDTPITATDAEFREAARRRYQSGSGDFEEGEIEVDDDATVSRHAEVMD